MREGVRRKGGVLVQAVVTECHRLGVETTNIYFLTVLGAGSLRSGASMARFWGEPSSWFVDRWLPSGHVLTWLRAREH